MIIIQSTVIHLDNTDFLNPLHKMNNQQRKDLKLRYYTTDIHKMAFVLPGFVIDALDDSSKNDFTCYDNTIRAYLIHRYNRYSGIVAGEKVLNYFNWVEKISQNNRKFQWSINDSKKITLTLIFGENFNFFELQP
ncbi:spermidine synthase-like, partial [Aphis craccivora]